MGLVHRLPGCQCKNEEVGVAGGMIMRREGSVCFTILAGIVAFCVTAGWWSTSAAADTDSTKHWVGTWSCAPYRAESNTPPSLSNNTLRQIVRVSIGGDTLRVKFSNITCGSAVTIKSVNIAASPDGTKSMVDASTMTPLKFNGDTTVTIAATSEVYSDPVAFNLTPGMRLAITTYYGECATSADMTFHYGSRTNSYLLSGEKTTSVDFNDATTVERWYTIHTVDVLAPKSTVAVAVIGNSITDGYGLSGGLQNRWTDIFSEALLGNLKTEQVGVLNLGIGATLVTSSSNGAASGIDRFKHDILDQSGLHWVIVFYGVNDINAGKTANDIIGGFEKMIADTRERDTTIKVYGGTITPFNGHDYYSPAHEAVRSQVNGWIRTEGNFDGCIDFDKGVRDPNDTSRWNADFKNDWLHPNVAGHVALGESVDLEMFIPPVVTVTRSGGNSRYAAKALSATIINGKATVVVELPDESFVSLKVYSILGEEIAELAGKRFSPGKHTIPVGNRNLVKGMYVYSLKTGNRSINLKMVVPGAYSK